MSSIQSKSKVHLPQCHHEQQDGEEVCADHDGLARVLRVHGDGLHPVPLVQVDDLSHAHAHQRQAQQQLGNVERGEGDPSALGAIVICHITCPCYYLAAEPGGHLERRCEDEEATWYPG